MIASESSGFHSFAFGPLVLITITRVRTEPGCFVPYLASTVCFQTKTSQLSLQAWWADHGLPHWPTLILSQFCFIRQSHFLLFIVVVLGHCK